MGKRHNNSVGVIVIAILLILVTFMDTLLVFRMTSSQTMDSGIYKLESIGGELENTINEAKNLTMKIAMQSQMYLNDKQKLEKYIYQSIDDMAKEENGCFNIYIAGKDWGILPGLENPEDFVATERVWYTGAVKKGGSAYVTPPYIDVVTGNICYTISVMLADGETVLGVDYTLENIQVHIARMRSNSSRNAVIVTGEGIIAGCSDETLIGKRLNDEIPEYASIFSLAKNMDEVVTTKIKTGLLNENLFAMQSGAGWYLIVSESDWELYKNSYIQLIVTVLLSIALLFIVVILYMRSASNQKNAEKAFKAKEEFLHSITAELWDPLRRIVDGSSKESVAEFSDYEEEFEKIHFAGNQLSEMIDQIISYSNIIRSEDEKNTKKEKKKKRRMNSRFRSLILTLMVVVMIISLYTNISATYRWGNVLMRSEVKEYEDQLAGWINTQKSILDMFSSIISTNPSMIDDYENTIKYLDRITKQYPEISAAYLVNPKNNPTVYMNTGWLPDKDFKVEERQWYIDTMDSETGWNISVPYYDEQTGLYCVTMAEKVNDAKTGEFLGVFGIDFYMDKLVDILGSSYSNSGYAFLVDDEGSIINHPYGSYQMSVGKMVNISELPYGKINVDGTTTMMFSDYDNTQKILIATRNNDSNFVVYAVSSVWKIYGRVIIYATICLIAFLTCIILVYRLLSDLIKWQDETNKQVQDSADAAIAAGKAKSQFLAQMSHEIRTPINAVLGMNEMILRESEEENILEYSNNIKTAGRTLLALINSILDFSKIEDGKMEIVPVKYELAALVNNLVNSISERTKAKNLTFEVEIDKKLPSTMYGDDVRVSQIIMNLLTNAVKYTEKGTVTLVMQGGKRVDDKIDIIVVVKDTGIGIKQEDMEKLFESFERIEERRNHNIEGTGLGMSIVTKLLEMMGSKLNVNSQYGQGSTFSFMITQTIVDSEPIGEYTERIEHVEKKELANDNIHADEAKVLVVDDNAMNLKVFKSLFKLYDIVPDMAMSGMEAIEYVTDNSYDIIFLDHLMPKMDGIETLSNMKEKGILKESTKVIALTANAVVGAKETYINAGFNDYLSKPIEVPELEKLLVKYLPDGVIKTKSNNAETKRTANNSANRTVNDKTDNEPHTSADAAGGLKAQPLKKKPSSGRKIKFDDKMKVLSSSGIDVEDGMRLNANNKDSYYNKLSDFITSSNERKRELDIDFDNIDFDRYENSMHMIVTASKKIGAAFVMDMAQRLEDAAKNRDADFIINYHDDLMRLYVYTIDSIESVM